MNKEPLLEGQPRTYIIRRHPRLGYGFMAGYESPTMVKIVTPDGPSYQRLMPGDVIMAVNGINVEDKSREQIIKMVQLCGDQIEIKVRQPTFEEIIRAKNPLLKRSNTMRSIKPEQVTETICSKNPLLNRSNTMRPIKPPEKVTEIIRSKNPLLNRSNTMRPIKPPAKVMEIFEVVIKIFFEVGHYRVLKYNQDTTTGAILETLNARLTGNSPHSEQIKRYFGLALTVGVNSKANLKEPKRTLLHILDENDSIIKIRQLPYAPSLRLLYRMVYPPSDVSTLYKQHKVAFEYLYQQSCNDLKLERFTPELDQDTALKLSALHLLEYVHSNHSKAHGHSRDPKVYIKLIKKTPGVDYFLPKSVADTMVDKKGKRIPSQYKKIRAKLMDLMKENFEEFDFEPPTVRSTTNLNRYSSTSFHELSLPEIQSLPIESDYIKLLFLNYLSQLPCYGNSKRSVRTSVSSQEQNSIGDCSSSLESVRLMSSDYSPLIKQDRNHLDLLRNVIMMPPPPPATLFTSVLTDEDLEKLKVPPPPRMKQT